MTCDMESDLDQERLKKVTGNREGDLMESCQMNKEEIKLKQENCKGFPIHAMKTRFVAAQIHSSLTWALNGNEWSSSHSVHFAFDKKSRTEGWMGFILGLDVFERSNVSHSTASRTPDRPTRSLEIRLTTL